MPYVHYTGPDGKPVIVSAENPLPVSGAGGGGGMQPEDITATAPVTWDAETSTVGFNTSVIPDSAADVGAVPTSRTVNGKPLSSNVALTASDVGAATSAQGSLAASAVQPGDLPVAAHVDPDTGTVADVVNALIAAGLMAAA